MNKDLHNKASLHDFQKAVWAINVEDVAGMYACC